MVTQTPQGSFIITGEHIELYRLLALKSALKLELNGLKMSRGKSASAIIKKSLGFKGNKESLLAQLEKYIGEKFPQKGGD